jgi:DNA segregation ATPase FtsK/SpoIIIE-like protein
LVEIAQVGEQVGLHLIIATHYYSPHVITGNLKYAIPSRISFRVNSGAKLRVILDKMGAEKLVGSSSAILVNNNKTIEFYTTYNDSFVINV